MAQIAQIINTKRIIFIRVIRVIRGENLKIILLHSLFRDFRVFRGQNL